MKNNVPRRSRCGADTYPQGILIDYKDYKKQSNKAVATFRDAKAGYEKKLIVNYRKRPKPFFKYMRSKQKTKTVRNLKKENGDLTGNDTETANLLQKKFSNNIYS